MKPRPFARFGRRAQWVLLVLAGSAMGAGVSVARLNQSTTTATTQASRQVDPLSVPDLKVLSAAEWALQDKAEAVAAEAGERLGVSTDLAKRVQEARGMSVESLAALPPERMPRLARRLAHPDLPLERAMFRVLQLRDETQSIPPNALLNALNQLEQERVRPLTAPARVGGLPVGDAPSPDRLLPLTAGLELGHWVALGPGNIGGRTRSIVIHPTQPETMWAGSVSGGVWKTTDSGASWNPVDDFMANLAVSSMVMHPTAPNTIYAGTGEGFYNGDAIRGAGLFFTRDGVAWQHLPSTKGEEFQFCNRLSLSSDGKVLLVATRSGLFRSSDEGHTNWTKVLDEEVADVDFHPTDTSKAIAGGLRTGHAYLSADGGATWEQADHEEPWSSRVEVTYSINDPSIAYASVNMRGGEIWRSTDGGQSFVRRRSLTGEGLKSNYLGGQGWYDNVIWAGDPSNPDFVIVGGIDLWRSIDGGDTLTDISTSWSPESVHADHHTIVAHPQFDGSTNKIVFFGNDGGVYKTDDVHLVGNDVDAPRKSGWTELNNTYGVTQFFGVAATPDGIIIGGAQDNGTLRFSREIGSEGWTEMFGGDGGHCAADAEDPSTVYGEYVYLNIHRSTDGGHSAEFISGNYWNDAQDKWDWKPLPYTITDARNEDANFIAPFLIDPNTTERVLAGGMSLWRTDDAKAPNTDETGPRWTPIKNSVGEPISAIEVARGDSNVVWVGHNDGSIYKTGQGTLPQPVWEKVDDNGQSPLPDRYCTSVVVDPQDHRRVFVTFGGFRGDNVWVTADAGATWRECGSATLPEAPVRTLAIHPNRPEYVYIGTEVGVFASEDGGDAWSPTNEGPTNCSVDKLLFTGSTLIAATHGRGIFTIDLSK